eukprot:1060502-Prorocentrum_minimum.AAC.3
MIGAHPTVQLADELGRGVLDVGVKAVQRAHILHVGDRSSANHHHGKLAHGSPGQPVAVM